MSRPAPLITSHPRYLSGAPIFTGTRGPTQNFFNSIEGGVTLEEFLDDFSNVTREQAIAVLELAKRTAIADAAKVAVE